MTNPIDGLSVFNIFIYSSLILSQDTIFILSTWVIIEARQVDSILKFNLDAK